MMVVFRDLVGFILCIKKRKTVYSAVIVDKGSNILSTNFKTYLEEHENHSEEIRYLYRSIAKATEVALIYFAKKTVDIK